MEGPTPVSAPALSLWLDFSLCSETKLSTRFVFEADVKRIVAYATVSLVICRLFALGTFFRRYCTAPCVVQVRSVCLLRKINRKF